MESNMKVDKNGSGLSCLDSGTENC